MTAADHRYVVTQGSFPDRHTTAWCDCGGWETRIDGNGLDEYRAAHKAGQGHQIAVEAQADTGATGSLNGRQNGAES
jgi:hypothetical protein